MRIGLITSSYPKAGEIHGGLEQLCDQVATGLVHEGHDVTVLTTSDGASVETHCNGKLLVRRFRYLQTKNTRISPGLGLYLVRRQSKLDVIINVEYWNGFLSLETAALCIPSKVVLLPLFHAMTGRTRWRTVLHALYRPLGNFVVARCAGIVCCSNYEASSLLSAFPDTGHKIRVFKPGIRAIRNIERERKGKRILAISALQAFKGVRDILPALTYLPDHSLDIVGDGPLRGELEAIARQLGITSRVRFHKFVTEEAKNQLFSTASVFVHLSKVESYSLVVGEALASGVPCVVLDANALGEWVDSISCLGVRSSADYIALAETIKTAEIREVTVHVPAREEYISRLEEYLKSLAE